MAARIIRFPVSNAVIGREYHNGRIDRAISRAEKLHRYLLTRREAGRLFRVSDLHAGRCR